MAGNINKLRDSISSMLGSGKAPAATARAKTKVKTKRMNKISKMKSC